jgi:hypothetical protein
MNDERFEGWLDGMADDGGAGPDPALVARRALQSRIDTSLRLRFAAPSAAELARFATTATANAWPWRRERQAWFALAALLLIALGLGQWSTRAPDATPPSIARCMQDAYSAANGAPATDACGELEADWVRSKLQRSALGCTTVAPGSLAVTHTCAIEGQASTAGTPFTSCVRALVDGQRVLLWSAPLASDPRPSISPTCGFVAYRGELEGRVLYEYSPLHEAVLLREIGAVLVP